jgi:ribosomal protein S3AE
MAQIKKKKISKALRKSKKKWFMVKAPESLNNLELSEITAYEPKELIGRTLQIPLREITKSPRDSTSKYKLRVIEVQGDTCKTEVLEFSIQNAQVQRMDRRAKEKIVCVVDGITKDKQNIRIKVYILLNNSVARSVRTVLQEITQNYVSDYIKHRDVKDVFAVTTSKTIANTLKKELSKIYPSKIIIWRIKRKV